jgi:hypothetical protein
MDDPLLQAIDLCRSAADKLDSDANRNSKVNFPGWDYSGVSAGEIERCEAIRRVAKAIVGTEDPDSGIAVTMGDVGSLIRYIADMLED